METNNKSFKKMKIILFIQLFILLLFFICLYYSLEKYYYSLLFILFLVIVFSFYEFYMLLEETYTNIRNVISYIDKKDKTIILDGDIGLLYDKVTMLERRNKAYEDVIKKEKENLKKTIEDICHQMKTPLSAISINNELLLELYDNKKIEINQKQIEKLKYLMNNLLTLAKLENNTVKFDFQKSSVSYLLNLTLENIYSLVQNKKIILENTNGEFYFDESWLVEALSNILKNCLEQDAVTQIKIDVLESEHYLKIIIKDNGHGFDQEDLKHLFDRFYKGKNSSKESVGIGLSITKEIIRIHHGYIDIYNNNGACFELTFPLLIVSDKT